MNLLRTKDLVQKEKEEVTMREKNGSVQCLLFVGRFNLGKFSIWFWIHLPTRLLQLCQRTMALPVGRGMFTLFSYHPVPTEQLPIPKLNLTGTLVRGTSQSIPEQDGLSSNCYFITVIFMASSPPRTSRLKCGFYEKQLLWALNMPLGMVEGPSGMVRASVIKH